MQRSMGSDLGLHCLPMFLLRDARHKWVKKIIEPQHDKTYLWEFPTRPDTNRPAQPQKLANLEISAIESIDTILSKQ